MLQLKVDWLTYSLLGLDPEVRWASSLNYFLYDSVKIFLLLFTLIAVIGFLRTYLSQQRIRSWLSGKGVTPYVVASLFGAITPFCSCSSIPIFIGFISAGVPLGVAFSFLITSPLINEYLVILMIGFFGPGITALYVVSGLLLGVVLGLLLEKMKVHRFIVSDMTPIDGEEGDPTYTEFTQRLRFGWTEAVDIIRKIWIWILMGVAIGAVIHNYVPQESIQSLLSKTGVWSVPLATVLGVPMYGSCAAIVPIATVLFQKGLPLGTALSFMMAMVALSLPEAVMLRRVIRLQLILIFFGMTTLAIIVIGYAFNAIMASGFIPLQPL